jgi:excinuclease UvrABC helicase subunit UvrB
MENLFDNLFNEFFKNDFSINESSYPKDGDPNFNKTVEESDTPTHTVVKETWESLDGSEVYQKITSRSKSVKGKTIQSVDVLKVNLQEAIDKEDFENAAKIRDQIKEIEK